MFLPSSLGMVLPIAPLDPVDESLWYPAPMTEAMAPIHKEVSAAGYNVGLLFTVQAVGEFRKICYWAPDTTVAATGSVGLWRVNNWEEELLVKVDYTGHSGMGWRTVDLPEPYIMSNPAKAYVVSWWQPPGTDGSCTFGFTLNWFANRGRYSDPYAFLYAQISNGQTDPRGFTRRNGFLEAGAFKRPTAIYNSDNYWVDLVINARPKPVPPLPPLTLKWPIPEGYPTFANTGVDPDVPLTIMLEPVDSTADGQLIENLDCRQGMNIKHANVTVRNCKVRSTGYVLYLYEEAIGARIYDSMFDGVGRQNINSAGIYIRSSNVEIHRCDIYRVENGIAFTGLNGPVLIKDSFIHNLRAGPGSPHYDGAQMDGANSNTTWDHCTIFNENGDTSCLMLDNLAGATDNVVIKDCYCAGGGYTLYLDERFHMDGSKPITNVQYLRNLYRPGGYGYFALSQVGTDHQPVRQGNQHLGHGGVYDNPPPSGFVGGQTIPESMWGFQHDVPASPLGEEVDEATGGLTIGLSFTCSTNGQIKTINWIRPNDSSAILIKVGLWRYLGSSPAEGVVEVGTETFPNVLRVGSIGLDLTTPWDIQAGENYVVAVFVPRGPDGKVWFVAQSGFFWPDHKTSQWGHITAFNNGRTSYNGFTGQNGMYAYGPDLQPPLNSSVLDSNYYVDPVISVPWDASVTGVQTTEAALQIFTSSLGPVYRVVVGAQTTEAVTQTFTGRLNRVVTAAQTLAKPAQSFTASILSASPFPDSTNTGHTRAPGYTGALTPFSGTITSNTTYSYLDFIDDGDVGPGVTNVTFIGCRFQSNAIGNDSGPKVWPFNQKINGGVVTYSYCTFCPLVSLVASPPNGVWPSAGAGTTAYGNEPAYMTGIDKGYQFALACYGTGHVTVDHCDIWGFGNAIDCNPSTLGAPITITNSWIHDAADSDPTPLRASGYHTDGPGYLNSGAPPRNILIRNCTIASIGNTNAIAFQLGTSGYQNIEVDGCYLSGFGVTVDMCHNASGNTGIKFTNNIISTAVRWTYRPFRGDNAAQFKPPFSTNQWFNNKLEVWPGTSPGADSEVSFTAADNGKFVYPNNTFNTTDWVDGYP